MIVGTALLMVKGSALEVPPPGAGLKTVTCAVPAAAISLAGIAAVNWLLLTNVVLRSEPFQRTTEPEVKLLPLTVRVKPAPPAVALEGESELSAGAGLLMVNVSALEVPPPGAGLKTVTCAVPPVAISPAAIEAVN